MEWRSKIVGLRGKACPRTGSATVYQKERVNAHKMEENEVIGNVGIISWTLGEADGSEGHIWTK